MPRDRTSYASSLNCLDLISQTSPGQKRLRSVSVEMSKHMIMLFLEGLIPKILKRLQALKSLELIVKKKSWTWASFDSCTTEKGRGSHLFDREFLLLIKSQLGHIKTITTTNYGTADNADEGPCPWIVEQLEKRNRAWTQQLARENRFVRTTCTMTTLEPMILDQLSGIEWNWRSIRGFHRDWNTKITPISTEPLSVFP